MDTIRNLADPENIRRFQEWCGLEIDVKKHHYHQQHTNGSHALESLSVNDTKIHTKNGTTELGENGIKSRLNSGSSYSKPMENLNGHSNNKTNGYLRKDINSNGYDSRYINKSEYNNESHMNGGSYQNGQVANGVESVYTNGGTYNNNKDSNSGTKVRYQVKNTFPYYLAKFGAFLGDEFFYLTFYPFLIWNIDSVFARKTIFVWTLVMFIGQATKDYLKVPRPLSPPVVHLELHHLNEFSLPSTHAMAGTVMPIMMAYLLLQRYEVSFWLPIVSIPVWTTVVCFSRLYLGVHSLLDVTSGVLYTLLIMVVVVPCVDHFDSFIQTHPLAPLIIWMIGLAACTVCYPAQGKDVAKGSGVRIVAIYMGLSTGIWLNYQFGISTHPVTSLPYHIMAPSVKWIILSIVRFVVGVLVLAVSKVILEKISIRYFSYLANLEKPNKYHPSVETGYIITTYSFLGILLTFTIPMIYRYLNISRNSLLEIS